MLSSVVVCRLSSKERPPSGGCFASHSMRCGKRNAGWVCVCSDEGGGVYVSLELWCGSYLLRSSGSFFDRSGSPRLPTTDVVVTLHTSILPTGTPEKRRRQRALVQTVWTKRRTNERNHTVVETVVEETRCDATPLDGSLANQRPGSDGGGGGGHAGSFGKGRVGGRDSLQYLLVHFSLECSFYQVVARNSLSSSTR